MNERPYAPEAAAAAAAEENYPPALAMLRQTVASTAHTVAGWQAVGFTHGVLNTDNMSVLGLTVDYGPFGWMEQFDPRYTPNMSDGKGEGRGKGARVRSFVRSFVQFVRSIRSFVRSFVRSIRSRSFVRSFVHIVHIVRSIRSFNSFVLVCSRARVHVYSRLSQRRPKSFEMYYIHAVYIGTRIGIRWW